jgi:hypothetical protein
MVAGSYAIAAAAILVIVVLLRRALPAATLQGVLSFFFIASLASGLEPGTVKAAALSEGSGEARPGVAAFLGAGAIKALAAAPFLALAWRFADPHMDPAIYLWLPLVAFAGFAATDLRVLFDLEGRHARAIWLKQGSLAGGLAVLAVLVLIGTPLGWAIGASTLARIALVLTVALREARQAAPPRPHWRRAGRLLADVRWMELAAASVIGAAGGSTDRLLGLRFLAPATFAGYYVLYELFSKFWLLPYLFSPIIFARKAAGVGADVFIGQAWRLTAAAGAAFVVAATAAQGLFPSLVARLIGPSFGWAIVAFAAAVAIGAFAQMRIAEVQGAGAARRAMVLIALSAVVSATLFFVFLRQMGAPGLMWAWLIKSVLDLAAAMVGGRLGVGRRGL